MTDAKGCGTAMYNAPEQLEGAVAYSYAADMYAIGCIMFEKLAWPDSGASKKGYRLGALD